MTLAFFTGIGVTSLTPIRCLSVLFFLSKDLQLAFRLVEFKLIPKKHAAQLGRVLHCPDSLILVRTKELLPVWTCVFVMPYRCRHFQLVAGQN
jgi:hypothetical protein